MNQLMNQLTLIFLLATALQYLQIHFQTEPMALHNFHKVNSEIQLITDNHKHT